MHSAASEKLFAGILVFFLATQQGKSLIEVFTKLLSRDRPDEIQLGAAKWSVSVCILDCLVHTKKLREVGRGCWRDGMVG